MLLKINKHEIISWEGKLRPSLEDTGIYPRVEMANYLYGLLQVVRLNHHSELVRLAYLLRMLSLGKS